MWAKYAKKIVQRIGGNCRRWVGSHHVGRRWLLDFPVGYADRSIAKRELKTGSWFRTPHEDDPSSIIFPAFKSSERNSRKEIGKFKAMRGSHYHSPPLFSPSRTSFIKEKVKADLHMPRATNIFVGSFGANPLLHCCNGSEGHFLVQSHWIDCRTR